MPRYKKKTSQPAPEPESAHTTLKPSRSAKKRASSALQKLGEELASLSPQARAELDLPPELADALALHDRISDHEGARRQRQFIGKLMRGIDAEPIARALASRQRLKGAQVAAFHKAEQWRQKFLEASSQQVEQLLGKFADSFHMDANDSKLAEIKSIVQNIHTENGPGKSAPPRMARQLFRALYAAINKDLA